MVYPSVHPRVCGEHFRCECEGRCDRGSSPRVRGTSDTGQQDVATTRFIPACAGNILKALIALVVFPVHPRVCGEHFVLLFDGFHVYGSSPRVRGTSRRESRRNTVGRFIPACAGNIIGTSQLRIFVTVHPRVCGEHTNGVVAIGVPAGSSPRVRGTFGGSLDIRDGIRFIPACAGNIAADRSPPAPSPVHPRVCGEHTSSICLKIRSIFKDQNSTDFSALKTTLIKAGQPPLPACLQAETIPTLFRPSLPEFSGLNQGSGNRSRTHCSKSRP